jgi:hypothetical protein
VVVDTIDLAVLVAASALLLLLLYRSVYRIPAGSLGTVYLFGRFARFMFTGTNFTSALTHVEITRLDSSSSGQPGEEGVVILEYRGRMYSAIIQVREKFLPAKVPFPLGRGAKVRIVGRSPLGIVHVVPLDSLPPPATSLGPTD